MAATPSASDRIRDTSTYSSMRRAADVDDDDARRARAARAASRRRSGARRCPAGRSRSACRPASRRCAAAGGLRARSRNRPLTATPPSDDEVDDVGVLDAVAEAAAGGDQRVLAASASRCETDEIHRHHSHTSSARVEHRAARCTSARDAACPSPSLHRHDAAVAAAEAAAHDALDRHLARPAVARGESARRPPASARGRRRRS